MLETVRAYAALELTAAGERDDALAGLARYCTAEASLAAEGLFGPAQVEWLDRVRDDLESYRGALTWLIERGRPAEAADIAWGLMYLLGHPGHAAEGLQWYEQILNLPSLPPAAESRALVGAAMMWYTLGELGRARTGAHTRPRARPRTPATWTWSRRLSICWGTSNMPSATWTRLALDSPAVSKGSGRWRSRGALGMSLNGMAKVALAIGDAAEAERLLDEATSALRHAGPWFLALVSYRRATLAVRRGNADEAIALVRESLTLFRQLHDKFAFVYALVPLAAAAVLKGDDEWAARILGARDAVTERTGATVVDKSVHDLGEQAEREVRARLGPDRWARAYAAGRVTSIDSLIKEIDGVLRSRTRA